MRKRRETCVSSGGSAGQRSPRKKLESTVSMGTAVAHASVPRGTRFRVDRANRFGSIRRHGESDLPTRRHAQESRPMVRQGRSMSTDYITSSCTLKPPTSALACALAADRVFPFPSRSSSHRQRDRAGTVLVMMIVGTASTLLSASSPQDVIRCISALPCASSSSARGGSKP